VDGLPKITTEWGAWKIFLCDERLVPVENDESTYGLYKRKLFPVLPDFPEGNFIRADETLAGKI